MSHLLKLVYAAGELNRRYSRVHEEIFGFSVRRLVRRSHKNASEPPPQSRTDQLSALTEELKAIQRQIEELEECDLTKRRGREICTVLKDYTQALTASVSVLNTICRRLAREQEGVDGWRNYSATSFRQDRITYDDAIQHHKRLGRRLQELLATF